MNKEDIKKALAQIKEHKKRKFSQSYDLIINLKNINIKQNPVNFVVTLPNQKGKSIKTACFAGPELANQAKANCDLVISEADFAKYDKKAAKKLASEYDYFIAQATLMPKIAKAFGKTLGTKGKMPNPKLGCVVPPNANLAPLIEKLKKSVQLAIKKGTNLQCIVGKEDMPDEQIIDNILSLYKATLRQLPNEEQNVKTVLLKLTMGKPVQI